MRKIIFGLFMSMSFLGIQAQNEIDALRFSTMDYGGTSRFVAMGSSFGALGGDVSVLSTNPAGLGLYRSGEFTITPNFISSGSDSEFYGTSSSANDFNFAINNLGYAQTYELKRGKWKKAQFAFSYNRLKDFHTDFRVDGVQSQSSVLDFIAAEATAGAVEVDQLETVDPFYMYPAYQSYLINPSYPGGDILYTDTIPSGIDLRQTDEERIRGRLSETIFGFATNYDDRLYLGFALAFQSIVRDQISILTESVVDTSLATLDAFEIYTDLESRGTGVNFKFGGIYRVNDLIRIGGSYTTPTWYTMSNDWLTEVSAEFDDGTSYVTSSPSTTVGVNEYNLRTPAKLMGSLSLVIAKQGLINVDYEYVDYGGAKLSDSPGSRIDFSGENRQIRLQYVPVGNVRIGGEYRYKALSFRGGYGFQPSPYETGFTKNGQEKKLYSAGIGYRKDRMNIDLAYRMTQYSQDYYPYDPNLVQSASIDLESHQIMATLGLRF